MKTIPLACLLAALLPLAPAAAQQYPNKPIRVIAPSSAGGPVDVIARILAPAWSEVLGQPMVIDNRAGAAGQIGTEMAAKALPDGYTVLLGFSGPLVIVPQINVSTPYDTLKDFAPVSLVAAAPYVLLVHPNVAAKTVKELVDFAKSNPNKLDYGSYGAGGAAHLAAELLQRDAGIKWTHVPYKGGAQAIADVLAGRLAGYFSNPITALPHLKSGKLRALATTGTTRMDALPDVPTFEEIGYPGFRVVEWNGFFVAKGTPTSVIDRLAKAVNGATKDPAVKARMESLGIEPVGNTPEQFTTFLNGEIKQWRALVQSNNIRAD